MATLQQVFGAEVRRRRLELGLTQERLAAKAGRHWTYVGAIERGERNVTLAVVAALAQALGTEPRELFPAHRKGGR